MMNGMVECWIRRKIKGTDEFLLLKRKKEKGGFWQPVCGQREKGEECADAAIREITEETGIQKKDITKMHGEFYRFDIKNHYLTGDELEESISEEVLGFTVKEDVIVDISNNESDEHVGFVWVDMMEAMSLLFWTNNKIALSRFVKKIEKE